MGTITFTTYREAFAFLFAARELGFTATHEEKRVTVAGIAPDDSRWVSLTDMIGPYRKLEG